MSARFDAGEEFRRRRNIDNASFPSHEQCSSCTRRTSQNMVSRGKGKFARYSIYPKHCWKRSAHVGSLYGVNGRDVIVAAHVLSQMNRAQFIHVEHIVERMLAVNQRLHKHSHINGTALLKIVKRAVKNYEHTANR